MARLGQNPSLLWEMRGVNPLLQWGQIADAMGPEFEETA